MVKSVRITYRRRHSYNTKSNKIKPIKTPGMLWRECPRAGLTRRAGGVLRAQYVAKRAAGPKCGDCKIALKGVCDLDQGIMKQTSH